MIHQICIIWLVKIGTWHDLLGCVRRCRKLRCWIWDLTTWMCVNLPDHVSQSHASELQFTNTCRRPVGSHVETGRRVVVGQFKGPYSQIPSKSWCHKYCYSRKSVLKAEHELEAILLGIRVPVRPVPVPCIVWFILNLTCWDTEGDSLVRFCSNLERSQYDTVTQEPNIHLQ